MPIWPLGSEDENKAHVNADFATSTAKSIESTVIFSQKSSTLQTETKSSESTSAIVHQQSETKSPESISAIAHQKSVSTLETEPKEETKTVVIHVEKNIDIVEQK